MKHADDVAAGLVPSRVREFLEGLETGRRAHRGKLIVLVREFLEGLETSRKKRIGEELSRVREFLEGLETVGPGARGEEEVRIQDRVLTHRSLLLPRLQAGIL